jgi:excisionase family DNA binding protein
MAVSDPKKELFTASEVARFCQVDLKTIHNWAERGEIRHFRTPGRHLRFKRADVLDFLRKYGYPVPEGLLQGKPRVYVIEENADSRDQMQRALSQRFEVTWYKDAVDALISIGNDAPDVVILDIDNSQLDGIRCIKRLKATDATRHVRVVVYTADEAIREKSLEAGASALVSRPDINKLRETLESLMGFDRRS